MTDFIYLLINSSCKDNFSTEKKKVPEKPQFKTKICSHNSDVNGKNRKNSDLRDRKQEVFGDGSLPGRQRKFPAGFCTNRVDLSEIL